MLMHNLVTFTLVRASDALDSGVRLQASRLQIDPGLVGELLNATALPPPMASAAASGSAGKPGAEQRVQIKPQKTLNAVSRAVEQQYMLELFRSTSGDFSRMAELLLGDRRRTRAVRLRFNQLGLKIRQLRQP
jgi:DNA-binding NtrC family response regulator